MLFAKIHNLKEIGASYIMLDITGLNIGDFIASSPQAIAAISLTGKFLLAVLSTYIARRIDNYFKIKEIEADKKKR